MKRLLLLVAVLSLAFAAPDCGGGGENPTPTPRPTNPVPTATAVVPTPTAVIPPTATAVPPTPTPTLPVVEPLDPPLPKLIGFTQVGDEYDNIDWDGFNYQSNEVTSKKMVANGFQAMHLWPNAPIFSPDMKKVICNPDIRVIAIRPQSRLGRDSDNCTDDPSDYAAVWENADYGQMAWDILDRYGDLACRGGAPLDIILNHWEGDWQAKGAHCRLKVPSERRWYRMKAELEMAQMGVDWAREEHPDAKLRVLFGMVTNHRTDTKYEWTLIRDGFKDLDPRWWPDLLGFSFYGDQGDETPFQAMDTAKRHTGYSEDRMYIAETGYSENYVNRQWARYDVTVRAMANAGFRLIFIWTWEQYWPGNLNEDGSRKGDWYGHWVVDENSGQPTQDSFTGEWTSGLKWLSDFRMEFEDNPLPAVTPPVVGTPTPTMTPTPRPPTATPTPDSDPCSACPPYNSIGCTVNEPACLACWENCGQPIFTPTPSPTPTRTPMGGAATPTPTPDPSDPCGHCPDPESFSCRMWPHTCEPCWEECGQPLATPTPRPPTPTPTPHYSDNPVVTFNYEGHPTSCDVALMHEDTGFTKTTTVPDCSQIHLTFDKVGIWQLQLTAQYAHGWATGESEELPPTPEEAEDPLFVKRMQGDVDNDGLYEHVYIRRINVLPRPDGPGPIA